MQKRLSLIMASVLAVFVAMGAVANTASAIESCIPKACCCSKTSAHGTTDKAFENMRSNCHGNSPCCQVQPSLPFPDMALSTSAETHHSKTATMVGLANTSAAQAQQSYFTSSFHNIGNLKIPQPPLYLQNQSFLC